jgi:hypothetical protein
LCGYRTSILSRMACGRHEYLCSTGAGAATQPGLLLKPLPPPIGRTSFPPVVAHEYLRDKLDAITVT